MQSKQKKFLFFTINLLLKTINIKSETHLIFFLLKWHTDSYIYVSLCACIIIVIIFRETQRSGVKYFNGRKIINIRTAGTKFWHCWQVMWVWKSSVRRCPGDKPLNVQFWYYILASRVNKKYSALSNVYHNQLPNLTGFFFHLKK